MNPDDLVAVLGASAGLLVPVGAIIGALGGYWAAERKSRREAAVAEANAVAAASTAETTAQDRLIDQLQEELGRYRDENDQRVNRLEAKVDVLTEENRGYRAFIGVQRDHMAAHGIPLPDWPEGLPR
jgi:pyruvate/2-oxoglutarate dehydrogenase complex dihydrolipoamide acyltransferase (E2) component